MNAAISRSASSDVHFLLRIAVVVLAWGLAWSIFGSRAPQIGVVAKLGLTALALHEVFSSRRRSVGTDVGSKVGLPLAGLPVVMLALAAAALFEAPFGVAPGALAAAALGYLAAKHSSFQYGAVAIASAAGSVALAMALVRPAPVLMVWGAVLTAASFSLLRRSSV